MPMDKGRLGITGIKKAPKPVDIQMIHSLRKDHEPGHHVQGQLFPRRSSLAPAVLPARLTTGLEDANRSFERCAGDFPGFFP